MSKLGELEKMKVTELKTAAKARGLSTVGNKKQLIERLLEANSSKSESTADDDDDEVNEDYVLGDGDEAIEDDQKSGDIFINEDVMLSPVIKSKPINNKSSAPEKENKESSPVILKSDAAKQDVTPTKVSPIVVKTLSEQERRELRAKRFNAAGDDKQKTERAERFGLALKGDTSTTKAATGSAVNVVNNLEKLQMRANRFGVVSATSLLKSDDKDRILKRKARFGIGTSVGQSADEEERKKKRAERFGMK